MDQIEVLKNIIEIYKRLIRYYQVLIWLKKNQKPYDPLIVIKQIEDVAKNLGFDFNLACKVAKCESGLNPYAININTNGSIDRGVFQWNDKWHPEISDEEAFNVEIATKLFCQSVNDGHLSWWNSSKSCWG